MANTTNYNWATPDDTAYVKDGAAAIRSLGSAIDSTLKAQIDAENADHISKTVVDAKGDLIVATGADAVTRLPVGINNQILTADSTAASGVKWASQSGAATFLNITGSNLTWTITNATFVSGTSITFTTSATHNLVVGMPVTVGGIIATFTTANPNASYTITAVTGTTFTAASTITALTYTSGGTVVPNLGGNINLAKYINAYFIIITSNGYLLSSPDGNTWTTSWTGCAAGTDIAYNGTNWVMIARSATLNGAYATSLTSNAWTQLNASIGAIATLNRIIWAGGSINLFVVVGGTTSGSGTGYIYTSPTGVTWTSRANTANAGIVDVDFDGTTLCAVHKGYSAATPNYYGGTNTSTNGTAWTSTNMSTGTSSVGFFSAIKYNSNLSRWMIYRSNGTVFLITTANLSVTPSVNATAVAASYYPIDVTQWFEMDSTYGSSVTPPSWKMPRIYDNTTNTFVSAYSSRWTPGLLVDKRYSGLVSIGAGAYVAPMTSNSIFQSSLNDSTSTTITYEGYYAYNGSTLVYVLDNSVTNYGIRLLIK
jgi:hypothetical protein